MSKSSKIFFGILTVIPALLFILLGANLSGKENIQSVVTAEVIDKEREQSVSYNSFGAFDNGVRFHQPSTTKKYSIGLAYDNDVYFVNTSREIFVQLNEGDMVDVLLHERVDENGNTVWRKITFN